MGSVYTAQCRDVTVHFKPPYREEYVLELPGGGTGEEGEKDQFVSYLSQENMITEKVVRGLEEGFILVYRGFQSFAYPFRVYLLWVFIKSIVPTTHN